MSLRRVSILLCVLAALMPCGPARMAAGQQILLPWWQRSPERKMGHYWVKTDLDAETAIELAKHLNLMYEEFSRRLASLPQRAPQKLNVLIFRDRRDYLEVLRLRYGVDGRGSGGMFFVTPTGAGLAFWVEDLPKRRVHHVIQHEGFHQFAYSRFGNDLSPWLNEGLAEFFGASVLVGRSLILGQSTPRVLDSVQEAIELGEYVPFARMLRMTSEQWQRSLHDGSASLLYNQSWSMVHFLVYGDGGRYVSAFEQYLRLLNSGVMAEEAFVRVFGADVQSFEERWKTHTAAARPSAFLTAMERIEFLAEGALELSRSGTIPGSVRELRDRLVAVGFVHRLHKHGLDVQLRAEDSTLYTIPMDDLARAQPVFELERLNVNQLPPRLRYREEQHPSPPSIRTRDLAPKGLAIVWKRAEDNGPVVGYEIAVR
jgi:hypothetical protein